MNPARLALFAAITFAVGLAHASEMDTEHLFAFTTGTDIGEAGEKEIESGTTGRFGKRSGSYAALSQTVEAEFTPMRNFRISVGPTLAYHDMAGVPGLDDRRKAAFDGMTLDLRYRLLDRERAPFGLAIDVEPQWSRAGRTGGEPVDQYGAGISLLLDKELVPERIVGAFNLLYEPEAARSRISGVWSHESTLGISTAVMARVQPGVFLGAEARYLRTHDGLGFDRFSGHAVYLGPTVFVTLSERLWLAAGWSMQLAGRAVDDPGSLDLMNFDRHQATFKFGFTY